MPALTFYEKPGCITNKKQKAILKTLGIDLVVRDLLNWNWSSEELSRYFNGLKIEECFNKSAPQIKQGAIEPEKFSSKEEAIAAMIESPILIRRPLMEYQGQCWSGFNLNDIYLRLKLSQGFTLPNTDYEACSNPD